ncbi:MAG: queuosine precursor transporter [Desulfurococcales archaeon]|nr:queuosine precursor transporter [Desulfurococcales archaeon]
METSEERKYNALIVLTGLFIASLTSSNFLASKIFSVNILGLTLAAPAAVLAYALTFTFTDIISEIHGRKAANMVVRMGFASQLLVLAYIWFALRLPIAPFSPVNEESYSSVIFSGYEVITASLIAYLISQHHDVWAFHMWKIKTQGRMLWLRNNASTIVSQLLDTVIFISLAFNILPALLGGVKLPWNLIGTIILGQYIVKVIIALLDTPLVYLGVAVTKNYINIPAESVTPRTGGLLKVEE